MLARVPAAPSTPIKRRDTGHGDDQAGRMAGEMERWGQKVPHLVPSLSPFDPRFEPRRYWRGPAWAIVNRMSPKASTPMGVAGSPPASARAREP